MCKATTRWRSWILPWRDSGESQTFKQEKSQKEKRDAENQVDSWIGGDCSGCVCVEIDNFSFGPATITVPAGTTVTWTNNDDVPHVVTSDDNKMFKSKALDTDDHFSFTFTKPGTYKYYCAIHPKMTAKIVVQ
jgi:plastocyanin